MSDRLTRLNSAHDLSRWTAARLGQGRIGASMTTGAVLDFTMDHARARDAIYTELPVAVLSEQLKGRGFHVQLAQSRATSRAEYLRRPDRGRSLSAASLTSLSEHRNDATNLLTIIIADGLSPLAPSTHALPFLEILRHELTGWTTDAVVIATQARVALGDPIAEARGAEASIILIGERPGLKSFDSLGAYLTYRPRSGRTDADRNCVSNIRTGGLSYEAAAFKLIHLLNAARSRQRSGFMLKDLSDAPIESSEDSKQLPKP